MDREELATMRNGMQCPALASEDDRKSAVEAARRVSLPPGTVSVKSFAAAREVLRSRSVRQAMIEREGRRFKGDHAPVFFLEGDSHRRKRSATARYFTPKAVTTKHRAVMECTADALALRLQHDGMARLDELSLEMAVMVAAQIVGLTDSDLRGMTGRIERLVAAEQRWPSWLDAAIRPALAAIRAYRFFRKDVRPAIAVRRLERRDDVISHLLDEGYSDQEILVECMTYASAGMITTREFIVMAAWHMFQRDDVLRAFRSADESGQLEVLEEILRLEPVGSRLLRRAVEEVDLPEVGKVPAGTLIAVDLHAANSDSAVAGACPHAFDLQRDAAGGLGRSIMSFGDGHHRCPGWQVALQESRILLNRILALPGIRMVDEPELGWSAHTMSYELRNAVVACDRS